MIMNKTTQHNKHNEIHTQNKTYTYNNTHSNKLHITCFLIKQQHIHIHIYTEHIQHNTPTDMKYAQTRN